MTLTFMAQLKDKYINKINSELGAAELQFLLAEYYLSNNNNDQAKIGFDQAKHSFITAQNLRKQYIDEWNVTWPEHRETLLAMQKQLVNNFLRGIFPTVTMDFEPLLSLQKQLLKNSSQGIDPSVVMDAEAEDTQWMYEEINRISTECYTLLAKQKSIHTAITIAQLKTKHIDQINAEIATGEQLFLLTESHILNANYEQAKIFLVRAEHSYTATQNLMKQCTHEWKMTFSKHHEKLLSMHNELLENYTGDIYPSIFIDMLVDTESAKWMCKELDGIIDRFQTTFIEKKNSILAAIRNRTQARALTPAQDNSGLSQNTVSQVHATLFSSKENGRERSGWCEPPPGSTLDEDGRTIVPSIGSMNTP